MRNPKYHIYLTPDERRTDINSLIDLRNDLISRGKYTDLVDELLIKLTKAKVKQFLAAQFEATRTAKGCDWNMGQAAFEVYRELPSNPVYKLANEL